MSDFLRFLGLGAKVSQAVYDVDIFNLKKSGCEKAGGKLIVSANANTCEVEKDGIKHYLIPKEIIFEEKQSGGKRAKKLKKKTKKRTRSNLKTRKNKVFKKK
jgi:hypothetical protein